MKSYAASGQLTSLQRGPFCAPIRGPVSMPIDTPGIGKELTECLALLGIPTAALVLHALSDNRVPHTTLDWM